MAMALLILSAATLMAQTNAAMFCQDVSWSPDGKYIAFTGLHDFVKETNSFQTDIYVMRWDGSGEVKITDDKKNEYYTSLSKKRIAYSGGVKGAKVSDIYTANYDGTDVRQITKDAGNNSAPAFSRDGKRIAFISTRDTEKYQIYVMNSDGSHVIRLTKDDAVGFFNPQWSPDGKLLVYYAEKGDVLDQVWTMNADGTGAHLLTAGIGHNIYPGWSADGRTIIFSSSKRYADTSGPFVKGSFLYRIKADGTDLAKLGNIQSFFARVSPDGKKIAYISGGFPRSSIFVADVDGSNPKQLTR